MVMELGNLRKEYFYWGRIIMGCMVLATIVMLCIGIPGYAKDNTEACKSETADCKTGSIALRQNAGECRRVANDAALFIYEDVRSMTEASAAEITIVPHVREESVKGREPAENPPVYAGKEIYLETSKKISEEGVADDDRKEISTEEIVENGREEISAEEDADHDREGAASEENAAADNRDTDAGNSGIRELSGFLVDGDGYITGVTERVNVTDGILMFARDEGCIGIRSGALSELAGCVWELYIPENIREIEPGALDDFLLAAYIEVAADHPYYYSKDGVLYSR
ncbi:MAG: hypothetical protein K1W22_08705 [Lachnospiraceae bacterium]